MSEINNGGPAFPASALGEVHFGNPEAYPGMTLRQYAAIKLRVPNSGTDWLDEMIQASLRDEFAAKAMAAYLNHPQGVVSPENTLAGAAYAMADAMLAAREAKQ